MDNLLASQNKHRSIWGCLLVLPTDDKHNYLNSQTRLCGHFGLVLLLPASHNDEISGHFGYVMDFPSGTSKQCLGQSREAPDGPYSHNESYSSLNFNVLFRNEDIHYAAIRQTFSFNLHYI
jgi:hypothetical protein